MLAMATVAHGEWKMMPQQCNSHRNGQILLKIKILPYAVRSPRTSNGAFFYFFSRFFYFLFHSKQQRAAVKGVIPFEALWNAIGIAKWNIYQAKETTVEQNREKKRSNEIGLTAFGVRVRGKLSRTADLQKSQRIEWRAAKGMKNGREQCVPRTFRFTTRKTVIERDFKSYK